MDKIETITIEDNNYPKILREIKDPPRILYYIGSLPRAESSSFAVVGTRMASSYGKQVALEIAGDLAEAGLTIVSGLAPGIDTFCHQAVVEKEERTIAVLGTGLDEKSIYPQSNLKLARKIIEKGLLISEYPPGTPGLKQNFPRRNRIISGLSFGVLVIEAKERSGSLITAGWALKQGKKVFAVPGSIYSTNSRGTNYLIKNGAKLVENANDILKELDLPSINKSEIIGETAEESRILEILKEGGLYIDEIIKRTGLNPANVSSALAIMEIRGKVRNLGGNIYAISSR